MLRDAVNSQKGGIVGGILYSRASNHFPQVEVGEKSLKQSRNGMAWEAGGIPDQKFISVIILSQKLA